MLLRSLSLPALVVMGSLMWACGDDHPTDPQDAGVDADMTECGGKPDGTPCGDTADSTCDRADTCQAGICVQNLAAADTACGDATATDCNSADTCDGAGACKPNLAAVGTACGDTTASDCNLADTCDGAGACQPNLVAAATACGDATVSECDLADTCDGVGACQPNHVAAATACGDTTVSECDLADTCDGAGACAPNFVAAATACGSSTESDCNLADSCNGAGACSPNLVMEGLACYDCAAGPGRCAECSAAGSCDDGPACVEPVTPGTLSTTFAAGNNHRGNMFDVFAVNDIVITSFDAHPMGNTTIEIYYRPTPYAGFETNATGWTLIGSAAVTAQPYGSPTAVPVPINVEIPAGQTYAFYVTSTNVAVSLNYTDGGSEGSVYTGDANLQIRQGIGMEYPFTNGTGGVFRPRVWNGVIHYQRPIDAALSTAGGAYGGNTSNGVMFDVVAAADVSLRDELQLELTSGTHSVDVYFRRGTFVGYEASVAGWEKIGGASSVTSAGDGTLSVIPLLDQIHLSAGETIGLYVDTGMASTGLRTEAGGNVGDVAASNGSLSVEVGRANAGMFGAAGAPAIVRAAFEYPVCVVQP